MMRLTSQGPRYAALALSLTWCLPGCSLLVGETIDEQLSGDGTSQVASDAGTDPSFGDAAIPGQPDAGKKPSSDAEIPAQPDAGTSSSAGDAAIPGQPDGDAGPLFDQGRVRFSLGYDHACGLFPSGQAKCWGANAEKQRDLPGGPFIGLSCGDYHTCVLDSDGALTCVGRNHDGQRVTAPGPYTQVAAGDAHSCALTSDGKVDCWGNDTYGQATPPPDVAFTQLTAGERFTCGIRKVDGKVQCWGISSNNRTAPPDRTFVSIDAGNAHACGRTSKDEAVCWGELDYKAPPLTGVTMVVAGNFMSCALLGDQSARCWGPSAPKASLPDPEDGPYVNAIAGPHATCLITPNTAPACYAEGKSDLIPPPLDYFAQ